LLLILDEGSIHLELSMYNRSQGYITFFLRHRP
jgi:hypothetical protein